MRLGLSQIRSDQIRSDQIRSAQIDLAKFSYMFCFSTANLKSALKKTLVKHDDLFMLLKTGICLMLY